MYVLVSKGVGCGQGEGKEGIDFLAEETACVTKCPFEVL